MTVWVLDNLMMWRSHIEGSSQSWPTACHHQTLNMTVEPIVESNNFKGFQSHNAMAFKYGAIYLNLQIAVNYAAKLNLKLKCCLSFLIKLAK